MEVQAKNTSGKFESLDEVHECLTKILDEIGKWRTNCRLSRTCKECTLGSIETYGLCGLLSNERLKESVIKTKLNIEEREVPI